jgi:HSP20 family protein
MLRKFDPFAEMFESWRDFDSLLRRVFGGPREMTFPLATRRLLPAAAAVGEFVPAVECFTRDRQLIVRAELPGVDPKQVEVAVTGNTLTIKGEKKEERKVEEGDLLFREISQGRFERSFELPQGVKAEQVRAAFVNGVLEITMPAAGLEPARKVPVEVTEPGKKTVKAA